MLHLPRLAYLALKFQPDVPKIVARWIPQADLIVSLAGQGISGTEVELGLEPQQLKKILEEGEREGLGSLDEFKILAASIALDELDLRKEDFPLSKFIQQVSRLQTWLTTDDALVQTEEATLDDPGEIPQQIKFLTGFTPLDTVTGGLYQGICTIIARPGDGKTTMMLSIMEALRKKNVTDSIWFFSLEIPLPLMLYRVRPIFDRVEFLPDDRIISGLTTVEEVIDRVEADPNPDRVILYDSPDVLAGGSDDTRRFVLEEIYRKLVRLKGNCKLVVTASQPRRKDRNISLDSVAEAWAKAWYSDVVVGLHKTGGDPAGFQDVRLNCVKNRFGIAGQEVRYRYDFGSLEWQSPALTSDEWGEDDW